MATAIEKFLAYTNSVSLYCQKTIDITTHEGEIILVRCDGFTFKTDKKNEKS